MFLASDQLEPILLKRLEKLGRAAGQGLAHLVISSLQAQNSAAGLEWSSNDGRDEGHQESMKIDIGNNTLGCAVESWLKHVSGGVAVKKVQYYAAAHALTQGILGAVMGVGDPAVPTAALDAAWQEDAAAGDDTLSPDSFKLSLATLATACSSDGTPSTAAACLRDLLSKLQGQPGDRWQGLLKAYSDAGTRSRKKSIAAGAAKGGGGDDDDDTALDALLAEDDDDNADDAGKPDIAPASDKSGDGAAGSSTAGKSGKPGDDDDGASSLGLSHLASRASSASAVPSAVACSTIDGEAPSGSVGGGAGAGRFASSKSLMDPEMKRQMSRALSGASSADLDAMPDDLAALEQRQASHAKASTKPARQPLLAGLMASELGKGHLAEMPVDVRSWADFKDKQAAMPPGAAALGARAGMRNDVAGVGASLTGLGMPGKQLLDQHLKAARGVGAGPPIGGNPLHNAIISGSAARQSVERERAGGQTTQLAVPLGILRHGSNGSGNDSSSPARSRAGSFASNSSRKLSISEPAPTGPQAEWKHLPALGLASRLHPAELRQGSRHALSRGGAMSPSASAAALIEDKLPMLPALTGARGQPPKAMELMRRPSQAQRSDGHHADPRPGGPPNAHLPGLGGGKAPAPLPARARVLPSKKSFRGAQDF